MARGSARNERSRAKLARHDVIFVRRRIEWNRFENFHMLTIHLRSLPVSLRLAMFSLVVAAFHQGASQVPTPPARVSTQEPKPPFPYRIEDVTIDSKPGVRLSATITLPAGRGPFPAAVLVCGSGPHDRNGGGGAWKPFLVIADYFARRGIATIRYDKRGVARSTGNYASSTSLDFADDAEAAVRFLATRRDVDQTHIGILGHSEGGMIAPIIAVRSPSVAFVVLLAAPGLPGDTLMLRQVAIRDTAAGKDPESDPDLLENRRLYAALRAARDSTDAALRLNSVEAEVTAAMPERAREAARQRLDRKRAILITPFWRFFSLYDPRPTLRALRKPVLAVTGTLDVQAPAKENLPEIAAALKAAGNRDFSVVEMAGLNHLFQTSAGVAPADYDKIDEIVAPRALSVITNWIRMHVEH